MQMTVTLRCVLLASSGLNDAECDVCLGLSNGTDAHSKIYRTIFYVDVMMYRG